MIGIRSLPRLFTAAVLLTGSIVALITIAPEVDAAACPTPTTDLGSVSLTVNVPATATYTIWTRMKAPSVSQNTVSLQVDSNTCFSVGGGSLVASSWTNNTANWIQYQNGSPANVITMSLNAGNHALTYIGTQAGVEIDRVILTSDTSCTPSGIGTNCESGDTTNPTISLQVLAGGQAVSNGQTVSGQLTFNSTASDASGIANVQFLIDGTVVNTATTSPYSYSWSSSSVGNGSHTIAARATDTKNNTATASGLTVNVSNTTPCTGTPSVPANFRVTGTSANSVSLAWNASTPAAGCLIREYRVYRNGSQVGTPTGTSFTDSGLTPSTTYSYSVVAVDTANHISAQSPAVIGATTGDTTAPSDPSNVRTVLIAPSIVALAWDASNDTSGIKEYVIYRNGTQVGTSASTAFTDATLQPSMTYSFTVRARDMAGNLSSPSLALSVTTLAGTNANRGDLNGDNKVSLVDLSILLSNWKKVNVPVTQGDVNGNGIVDLVDLSMLLSNWGKNL